MLKSGLRFLSTSGGRNTQSLSTSLYLWGNGTMGQLGFAKFEVSPGLLEDSYIQVEPRRLIKSKDYVSMACGSTFTLVLSANGKLFGFGQGFLGANSQSRGPQVSWRYLV